MTAQPVNHLEVPVRFSVAFSFSVTHLSVTLMLMLSLLLTACTQESLKPPSSQASGTTEANAPGKQPAAAEDGGKETEVIKHNLSSVSKARQVTAAQLQGLEVNKATEADVRALLGDIEAFKLGDGKHILRYDLGKFIFNRKGVLIRKFLNP